MLIPETSWSPGTAPTQQQRDIDVMDSPNPHYAKYKTCYRLLDDLNDLIDGTKPKADVQDVVRRLFIVVAMIFRREERSYAERGLPNTPSQRQLHSKILAKFLRMSDELDESTHREDWIACASRIGRELAKDIKKKQILDGP